MRELLAELRDLGTDDRRAITLIRMLREEVLVIRLGRIVVVAKRRHFGHDLAAEDVFALQFVDNFERDLALLVRMREHGRAILRADIVALTVELRRIVRREENLQNLAIADDIGIEHDLDDFGVPGVAVAHLLVGRIHHLAARIAGFDGLHALDRQKHGFSTPETTAAERRGLESRSLVHACSLSSAAATPRTTHIAARSRLFNLAELTGFYKAALPTLSVLAYGGSGQPIPLESSQSPAFTWLQIRFVRLEHDTQHDTRPVRCHKTYSTAHLPDDTRQNPELRSHCVSRRARPVCDRRHRHHHAHRIRRVDRHHGELVQFRFARSAARALEPRDAFGVHARVSRE
ncbi:hypothetical protein BURKHO8Y_210416 [Burkholderia sp. 8Y]|nr:hypothetical protein BURKHO8Y_210416 [Burkholderia sp. 8Y]